MNMTTELKCQYCDRYLGKAYGTIVAEIRCSNSSCKGGNQFKIINGDNVADIRFKFVDTPQPPKKKEVEVS